ncbi:MAG TPA: hypothetical protein VGM01_10450 [Ktedonobacteraceae bacterium]
MRTRCSSAQTMSLFFDHLLDFSFPDRYNLFMPMHKPVIKTPVASSYFAAQPAVSAGERRPAIGLVICTLAFLACILLTVTPLIRMPDSLFRLHMSWGAFLGEASLWLPANLGKAYLKSSASIEFFSLITLAFVCHCLGAWLVGRWPEKISWTSARACIWLGVIVAGAIYVVTPGILSHDTMVYAGYSRLLAVYHANPYFAFYSAFPRDPLASFDQWSNVNSLYGPIWMLVCAALGQFVRPTPESYIIAFRLFALSMHLLNMWLVDRALYTMVHSKRVRALGMLLYGWNPLVLLESSLNGHNDVFMLTFVLLGVLLVARAEQRGELLRVRGYLPPLVALTLAALVKFTILPVLAAYLLFLACKASQPTSESSQDWKQTLNNWRPTALLLLWSCLVAVLVALAFYGPFWFGHNLHAIIESFAGNPASGFAENSYQRSIINWLHFHPALQSNFVLLFLSWRKVWDSINYLVIVLCLILGARHIWEKPTVRAFLELALAIMCLVLLLTPWFFTWYITWIVGLAVVCLPAKRSRFAWSFFFLALAFSYSALSLYLFNQGLLGSRGYLTSLFDTVPPICAFLFCWFWYPRLRAKPVK